MSDRTTEAPATTRTGTPSQQELSALLALRSANDKAIDAAFLRLAAEADAASGSPPTGDLSAKPRGVHAAKEGLINDAYTVNGTLDRPQPKPAMTTLVDVSRYPLRCHDRGSCFTWPPEPEFTPICACNELWEGKTCDHRQHNPFSARRDKISNAQWRDTHGVACTFNESAKGKGKFACYNTRTLRRKAHMAACCTAIARVRRRSSLFWSLS